MKVFAALSIALVLCGCACTRPCAVPQWEYRFISPAEVEKIMRVPVGHRPDTGEEQVQMRLDRITQWLNAQGDKGWEAFNIGDEGVWLKRRKD